MLSQQIEDKKKKNDFQVSVDNIKRIVSESQAGMAKGRSDATSATTSHTTLTKSPATGNKSVKDYSIMSSDRHSNGTDTDPKEFEGKKFKSRYIDDNGAWTRESVDDGYVEFKDYIEDRRKGVDFGVSFNDKEFKPQSTNYDDYEDVSYNEREYDPIAYDYSEAQSSESNELYPYTIAESLGETAGIGDIWSSVKNTALTAWDGTKTIVRNSPAYEMAVQVARGVWKLGAEHYLRPLGYISSAWLLEHSLQDNPSDIVRGNDSELAYNINESDEYKDKLDIAIKNSNGRTLYDDFTVVFREGDLFYSIHKANVHVEGYKRDDGKWFVTATLDDEYDYTEFLTFMGEHWYEFSTEISLGSIANDFATLSQIADAINPYHITIKFYTVR